MESRRTILKSLALGAALAALSEGREPEVSPAPWWLLQPMREGSPIGLGWALGKMGAIEGGAAILELHHRDGRRARVHLCRHNGVPAGLAHGEEVDMILMDGGDGGHPTDETLGRVLLALADQVSENEATATVPQLAGLTQMRTHAERVRALGAENLA